MSGSTCSTLEGSWTRTTTQTVLPSWMISWLLWSRRLAAAMPSALTGEIALVQKWHVQVNNGQGMRRYQVATPS